MSAKERFDRKIRPFVRSQGAPGPVLAQNARMLPMIRRLAVSALSVGLGAGLAACSSSNANPGPQTDASTESDTATDGDTVTCENEPGLDTYVANLTKTGKAGTSFVLVAGDPAPPQRGMNTWTLKVTDAAGKALAGATLGVKPFMPQHGHGSSQEPQIQDNGDGTYTIGNLYLFMPGLWTITITATAAGAGDAGAGDSAVFTFCIAG